MRPAAALAAATVTLAGFGVAALLAQRPDAFSASYDHPAIQYTTRPVHDRISRLNREIQDGKVHLAFDRTSGYLPALLKALDVPIESQVLVFSETSSQAPLINPRNPRAVFFSDAAAIGWVRGGSVLEIAAQDPTQGVIFYSLEQKSTERPQFKRDNTCLECHLTWDTLAVPGVLAISTFPMSDDKNAYANGFASDHRSPLAERWGGWYVTGRHGAQTHLGNLVGASAFERHTTEPGFRGNLADLTSLIDTRKYLQPRSDIVALMVLEHQSHMHNYITRLNYETRIMMETYGHIRYLNNQVNAFLRYLLFTEESPLSAPVGGDPQFVADFTAHALRDSKGRSLRDLDLQTRMFKHPCSFLIYSEAFDAMPTVMREHLLQRLYDILTGQDADPQFASLGTSDRQAILEILRETKSNLPDYWHPLAAKQ